MGSNTYHQVMEGAGGGTDRYASNILWPVQLWLGYERDADSAQLVFTARKAAWLLPREQVSCMTSPRSHMLERGGKGEAASQSAQ